MEATMVMPNGPPLPSEKASESSGDAYDEALVMVEKLRSSITKTSMEAETDGAVDRLIHKWWFGATVNVAIALNSIQMGLETDHPQLGWLWVIFENIFSVIFLVECLCKLWVLQCQYFLCQWNLLDFFLVIFSILDWILAVALGSSEMDSLSVLRIVRLFRLFRVVKLLSRFEQFMVVLQGVVDAAKTCVWVGIVLSMTIYVFAIFSVKTVGQGPAEDYPGYTSEANEIESMQIMTDFNPYLKFGSIYRAMLTLLNMTLLAEWTEIATPMLYFQPYLLPFFVVFVMFATLGIMNVIIGMICDSVLAQANKAALADEERQRCEKVRLLEKVRDLLKSVDQNADGRVDAAELKEAMKNDHSLTDLIASAQLPEGYSAEELVMLLDNDGDGWLGYAEFVRSFYRLIDGGDFQRLCLMQSNINTVKHLVGRVLDSTTGLNNRLQALEDRLLTRSGQGECVDLPETPAIYLPEQLMDSARKPKTEPNGPTVQATAEVQAHHWQAAIARLTDVSNTILLELSRQSLDVLPTRMEADPFAYPRNITRASESINAGLRSNSLSRSSPSVLPRPPSRDSMESGLGSAPQAGGSSAWSHSCEHRPLPKLRDEPPSSINLSHKLRQTPLHDGR